MKLSVQLSAFTTEALRSTTCEGEVRCASRERSTPDYFIRGCDANSWVSHLFLFHSIWWIIRRAASKAGRCRRSSILLHAILFGGIRWAASRQGVATALLFYSTLFYSV